MGQTEYSGNFVENLFSFLRQLVNQLSKTFQSGSNIGSGALNWFASNWLKLVLILVVTCVVVDWLVWMVRWRPYWLWFRKKRVILDDDFEDEEDEIDDRVVRSKPQYRSKALSKNINPRHKPPRRLVEEDEFYETTGEEDFENSDYMPDEEALGEEDEFDELLRNTFVAEETEEEDPFIDMPGDKPAPSRRGVFPRRITPPMDDEFDEDDECDEDDENAPQDEDESEDFFDYDESEDDLFFDQDALSENALFPLAADTQNTPGLFADPRSAISESFAPPAPDDIRAADDENPWRTGYTTKVPKIDMNSPELSRKMRRRLKSVNSDE